MVLILKRCKLIALIDIHKYRKRLLYEWKITVHEEHLRCIGLSPDFLQTFSYTLYLRVLVEIHSKRTPLSVTKLLVWSLHNIVSPLHMSNASQFRQYYISIFLFHFIFDSEYRVCRWWVGAQFWWLGLWARKSHPNICMGIYYTSSCELHWPHWQHWLYIQATYKFISCTQIHWKTGAHWGMFVIISTILPN